MQDHTDCKRGFTQLSKAWYGKANLTSDDIQDEIMIGMYHPEGGTTGEFSITWKELAGEFTPVLKSFEDSWSALWIFKDVLEKLAELDSTNPTADQIATLLESLGIENMTQTTR